MSTPVEFWFDFVSPYSYIAAENIEVMAARHRRAVAYKPFLLGAIFPVSKSAPLTQQYGPKASYSVHDILRSARYAGVPLKMPTPFPMMSQNTARALLYVTATAPEKTGAFARGAMKSYFTESAPMNDAAWLAAHAASLGLDGAAVAAACSDAVFKDQLKANCDAALQMGVFGAPWIVVDGEHFWGHDRMPQVERWLETGGF
jgi:2-hydroxychromene-2-carboxylate isomerase